MARVVCPHCGMPVEVDTPPEPEDEERTLDYEIPERGYETR